MKNTILGIGLTDWTVTRISQAAKETKHNKDSWRAGYSTARAEMEVLNEYRNGTISGSEYETIMAFLRNLTINYKSPIRESLYKHDFRKRKKNQ